MNFKKGMVAISFIVLLLVQMMMCISAAAVEGYYELSIVDKAYTINPVKQLRDWVSFNITITLFNSGTIESDNITVTIEDEDAIIIHRNGTILPNKEKTFYFHDHLLRGMVEHQINISYFPTNKDIELNENNSGKDIFIFLKGEDGSDSTPGFELSIVFFGLLVGILLLKKRKKK